MCDSFSEFHICSYLGCDVRSFGLGVAGWFIPSDIQPREFPRTDFDVFCLIVDGDIVGVLDLTEVMDIEEFYVTTATHTNTAVIGPIEPYDTKHVELSEGYVVAVVHFQGLALLALTLSSSVCMQ